MNDSQLDAALALVETNRQRPRREAMARLMSLLASDQSASGDDFMIGLAGELAGIMDVLGISKARLFELRANFREVRDCEAYIAREQELRQAVLDASHAAKVARDRRDSETTALANALKTADMMKSRAARDFSEVQVKRNRRAELQARYPELFGDFTIQLTPSNQRGSNIEQVEAEYARRKEPPKPLIGPREPSPAPLAVTAATPEPATAEPVTSVAVLEHPLPIGRPKRR